MGELIAITGANGFIGRALVNHLLAEGFAVRALQRRHCVVDVPGSELNVVEDMDSEIHPSGALADVSVVVHLAARVHQDDSHDDRALALYEKENTLATLKLARAAAASRVRRFLFLSTVAVNGESTQDKPMSESDRPSPTGSYAVSKWKAEQGLNKISQESGLQVVILRPPLVYGPNVVGNFLHLMHLASKISFLPFDGLDNRRSMVGVRNLCDIIVKCILDEKAAGQTFFVSDGQDLSVAQLIRLLSSLLHRWPIFVPVPKSILKMMALLAGKRMEVNKLTESFVVDIGKAREILNWTPPNSVESEIARTVHWFKQEILRKGV